MRRKKYFKAILAEQFTQYRKSPQAAKILDMEGIISFVGIEQAFAESMVQPGIFQFFRVHGFQDI